MTKHDYDLFVIGGGSAGVRAARIAAGHGAKVALAEEYRMGGTCVIRGCVPKKLLVYASRFRDEFEDAVGFGWTVGKTEFDWRRLIAAKDKEIARLEGLYRSTLKNAGVTVFDERALVAGANAVALQKSVRTITVGHILIATGGHPVLGAEMSGLEHVITSNEAFHLPDLPRRVAIYGGGYIAMEFAGIFAGLGSETTIIYRGEKILRGFDEDLRDGVTEACTHRGLSILNNTTIERIERTRGGLVAHLNGGRRHEADVVMYATGRAPNVAGLGLETAGVEVGKNGRVVVDASLRTSVPSIYAVGDVCDRFNLTPIAIREGHAFADSVFGKSPWVVDHEFIPTAVFSTPEVGTVGLGEHDAGKRYPKLDVYKARFRPLRATLSGREERTLMKLLVDGDSGRVVGCHVLGSDAAEIVQMAAIAMRMGATKADFDRTVALHPTAAEELVTMRTKWTPPAAS